MRATLLLAASVLALLPTASRAADIKPAIVFDLGGKFEVSDAATLLKQLG